jgi:hypothetical protein
MHKLTFSMLASAAALAMASPASAQTVTVGQGPNFDTHITASTVDTTNNALTVRGSTTGVGGNDVAFTGNTQIHITDGNGFASISDSTDATHTGLFTSLIINPDPLFSALQFNLSLDGASFLQIDYRLNGSDLFTNLTTLPQTGNANTGYTVTAGNILFDAIRLTSCSTATACNTVFTGTGIGGNGSPINFERQNSINISTVTPVPEPGTWAMMLIGFGAMGAAMRRRRKPRSLLQLA